MENKKRSTVGYLQAEVADAVGSKWAKRIGVITMVMVIYIVISGIFSIWPFSVAKDLAQKVVNAEAIISNYEWFYDMKAQIDATAVKAKIARGEPEEKGIKMVLVGMIEEYNARSKMVTRNMWKADDLPYQISLEGF